MCSVTTVKSASQNLGLPEARLPSLWLLFSSDFDSFGVFCLVLRTFIELSSKEKMKRLYEFLDQIRPRVWLSQEFCLRICLFILCDRLCEFLCPKFIPLLLTFKEWKKLPSHATEQLLSVVKGTLLLVFQTQSLINSSIYCGQMYDSSVFFT